MEVKESKLRFHIIPLGWPGFCAARNNHPDGTRIKDMDLPGDQQNQARGLDTGKIVGIGRQK
jgi:hypothetical protein